MIIEEIIKLEPESRNLFKRYGLDPYIDQEFENVCASRGINPLILKEELIALHQDRRKTAPLFDQFFNNILKHHEIVKDNISNIHQSLKSCIAKEDRTSELPIIQEYFLNLAEILEIHLYKEEVILFPEFKFLWSRQIQGNGNNPQLSFSIMYPIETLENEHKTVRLILTRIKQLIRHHIVSKNTGTHSGRLRKEFKILEKNLNELIRLENTILFPEALAIEKQLNHETDK